MDSKPSNWEDRLTLYVGYLVHCNRQSATVKSYVSAIRAVLQENDIEIQENKFLISALTKACKLNNDIVCTHQPIHREMLDAILKEIHNRYLQCDQPYMAVLLTCIFSTAYFGHLQIGEIVDGVHAIKAIDEQIAINKRKMKFTLRLSKTHGKYANPQIVKISNETRSESRTAGSNQSRHTCPYKLLWKYIQMRGSYRSDTEYFFTYSDGKGIPAHRLRSCLKTSLVNLGYKANRFLFQSLTAGRASDMLKYGISVETIKRLGRWKSNAVYRYLKD